MRQHTERIHVSTPATSSRSSLKELTFRGIVIGGIITLVFTAANVYLGLKVGLTFATSIPAAVISMAILRFFSDHTIQENNIVQTIASAAGTLSAVIFILPGLVIVGWWSGFPYWTTMAVCAVGGILGVMYSIPLRRALVTGSDLPYPEGVAGAEILKVGDSHEKSADNSLGLRAIIWGAICSAAMSLLSYMKVAASSLSATFRVGAGATSIGTSLSLALIGVGHLVGLTVGIAMLIGMFVSFFILIPYFSVGQLDGSPLSDIVDTVFSSQVRYIGAGVMAVAAIWTLVKIISPIIKGIRDAMRSSRTRHAGGELDQTERDIPITIVALVIVLSMIPVGGLLWIFTHGTEIAHNTAMLIAVSVIFTLLAGLLVAAVCGYMAGLIGSSNSPVSGVGILVVVLTALAIVAVHGHGSSSAETTALIAYTLFTAAIVFCIATISNDNLQDLKTGQLVGATPWKQQVALVIGVVFGALIIPPVLNLMQNAFGFQGAPGAGQDALAAPQASLISSLAQGVVGGTQDWSLLGLGAIIGVGIIIVDELLKLSSKGRFALPPLAVGMGMYLPASLTIMIPVGGVIGFFYDRWSAKRKDPERARRMGTLLATGLIVGESLFGVIYAGFVGATGSEEPLAVLGDSFATPATIIGAVFFFGSIFALYRWTSGMVSRTDSAPATDEAAAEEALDVH